MKCWQIGSVLNSTVVVASPAFVFEVGAQKQVEDESWLLRISLKILWDVAWNRVPQKSSGFFIVIMFHSKIAVMGVYRRKTLFSGTHVER